MRKIAEILGYKIKISKRADVMRERYDIDDMQIISCITYLGINELNNYESNDADVLSKDVVNNFAVTFNFNGKTINVISIISENNIFTKSQISNI